MTDVLHAMATALSVSIICALGAVVLVAWLDYRA